MISAIVLAAGQATRFGQCKQVLRLGGKTILDHALDNLRASKIDDIVIVLGAHAEEIREKVRLLERESERIVMNPDFASGMSSSIQAGLRALPESAEAAMIVLGDQPFVTPGTIDLLIDECRRTRASVVVPTYNGFRGNPVIVDRSLFGEMLGIRGDVGCRAIFGDHVQSITKVPVDDRGVLVDIDTREDFDTLVGESPMGEPLQPYATATVVRAERPTSSKPGDKAVIHADGTLTGWIGGSCAHDLVVKNAIESLRDGEPRLLALSAGDMTPARSGVIGAQMQCYSGGALDIFIEPHFPVPQLIVVGTQPIARSLVKIGKTLSFHVTVVDPLATRETVPAADTILNELNFSTLPLRKEFFIVVATHGRFDEEALEQAVQTDAPYIALVASRKRGSVIVQHLRDRGVPESALARIKAPAGLDIGARGSDEIALSILAEIVQIRRSGAAVVTEAPARVETVTDPICGMTVAVAEAGHVAEHDGRRFYFCCEHCQHTFERDPHRYAHVA
ncbi:MAG TPA: NTP transferase domain-containing protein [Thermoanaerobaculia bacterium]|jgi:xanthine dehydrogenase accessory factor|nr:NTP transferase domain-containing protein [Thermoanaerobaculia bacterium]